MAKTRQQKEQEVSELTKKLQSMKGSVIVDYKGLGVKQAQKIREESWGQTVNYSAVKKSLLSLAIKNAGLDNVLDSSKLEGNIGIVVGQEDEVGTAKFAAKFAKEFDSFKILGGLFGGEYFDSVKVNALALLPSKEELLAKLVGSINAPISGFVNVLAGNLRGLVQVLNSIKESKS